MSDGPPPGWKLQSKAGDKMRAGSEAACTLPATIGDIIDYAGAIIDALGKVIDANNRLVERVAHLEARPELKYLGVWRHDQVYGSGTFITDNGSLWHAQRASVGERPGAGDAWILAAKKGRDGRDSR
jgi:hypothetical protein